VATEDVLERSHPGKRSQLKRDILQSALLCFNEGGLELTTIEMIRARCNTSVGNIYHHFGNKEGLIAELFFSALEAQAYQLQGYMVDVKTARDVVVALVHSYVDWVVAEPELVRFQYAASAAVAKGPRNEELERRNALRNKQLAVKLAGVTGSAEFKAWPVELLPALIIGQAESYSRAWLAGRVTQSPDYYRRQLAQAAWSSIASAGH
jgi:AcrR family transcriptional regulator